MQERMHIYRSSLLYCWQAVPPSKNGASPKKKRLNISANAMQYKQGELMLKEAKVLKHFYEQLPSDLDIPAHLHIELVRPTRYAQIEVRVGKSGDNEHILREVLKHNVSIGVLPEDNEFRTFFSHCFGSEDIQRYFENTIHIPKGHISLADSMSLDATSTFIGFAIKSHLESKAQYTKALSELICCELSFASGR